MSEKNANHDIKDVTVRSFHYRLEEVIVELGVSKKDFAKAGGVTPQALSGYLKGRRKPDYETIAKWAREYNLNTNYLLLYRGTVFRSEADNRNPMGIEEPGKASKNPPNPMPYPGPITESVAAIESAMGDADEMAVMKAVVNTLESRYRKLAGKRGGYGKQLEARENMVHEDRANYPAGQACGIDNRGMYEGLRLKD